MRSVREERGRSRCPLSPRQNHRAHPACAAMASPSQDDLTPISGAQTDVAPLGRSGPKPAHELTADEERGTVDWDGIAAMPDFKALVAAKVRFIVIGTIFFCIYYFLLLVLVGYAPEL